MSAEFRALVERKLHRLVYGEGKEETDWVDKVAKGYVRDWGEYKDLSGYIRGVTAAMNEIQAAWEEIYEPKPPREEQSLEGRDV